MRGSTEKEMWAYTICLFPSQTRTRNQLFVHLVEEIAQSIEDIDGVALSRELVRMTGWNVFMHSEPSQWTVFPKSFRPGKARCLNK